MSQERLIAGYSSFYCEMSQTHDLVTVSHIRVSFVLQNGDS